MQNMRHKHPGRTIGTAGGPVQVNFCESDLKCIADLVPEWQRYAIRNSEKLMKILISRPGYGPWYENRPGCKMNNIHYYIRIPGSF